MEFTLFKNVFKRFRPSPQQRRLSTVVDTVTSYFKAHQEEEVFTVILTSVTSDVVSSTDNTGTLTVNNIMQSELDNEAWLYESSLIPLGYYCTRKKSQSKITLFVLAEQNS